jgi:hypothetical protein
VLKLLKKPENNSSSVTRIVISTGRESTFCFGEKKIFSKKPLKFK